MKIAGIIKSSFIDYPGSAAVVIFLGGCNFSCGYCHNPEIVRGSEAEIEVPDFLEFLKKRRRFVDAVCISGGEPTLYGEELYELIARIRELGYRIKLDTNGTAPVLLRRLLEAGMVEHAAMDVKGPWEKYAQIVREGGAMVSRVQESLALLMEQAEASEGAFTFELRTTVCRELLDAADIENMARQLSEAPCWYLQTFKRQGALLDEAGAYSAYSPEEMERLRAAAETAGTVKSVRVR